MESLCFEFRLSLLVFKLEILLFNLVLQFSDVKFLNFLVSVLRSLQVLNLGHRFILTSVFQWANLYLFEVFHFYLLILESTDLLLVIRYTSLKSLSIWIWCSWSFKFKWSKTFLFSASTIFAFVYSPSNFDLQESDSAFFCWTSLMRF